VKAGKLANENDITKIYGNAHVGGQVGMWDKTEIFQGEKFGLKFEQLEIEEFLNENGLNETDVEFLQKLESSDIVNVITQQNNNNNNNSVQQTFNTNNNQPQQQQFQTSQIQQQNSQNVVPKQQQQQTTFQLSSACSSPKQYSSSNSSLGDNSQHPFDYSIDNDLSIDSIDFENFNTKTRKFSEEELKPQPILKKSKKVHFTVYAL
jgi:hypothetical protein